MQVDGMRQARRKLGIFSLARKPRFKKLKNPLLEEGLGKHSPQPSKELEPEFKGEIAGVIMSKETSKQISMPETEEDIREKKKIKIAAVLAPSITCLVALFSDTFRGLYEAEHFGSAYVPFIVVSHIIAAMVMCWDVRKNWPFYKKKGKQSDPLIKF